MRHIAILLLLLALPALADECTDACDDVYAADMEVCQETYDFLINVCFSELVSDFDECDIQQLHCYDDAEGDPEAEAICDSLSQACYDQAHQDWHECDAEAEEVTDACIETAEQAHIFCIEQCEGTPTRRRTWGTVKALY